MYVSFSATAVLKLPNHNNRMERRSISLDNGKYTLSLYFLWRDFFLNNILRMKILCQSYTA